MTEWKRTVPFASHFIDKEVTLTYYRRTLIEHVWRIRLSRVSQSKAIYKIAQAASLRMKLPCFFSGFDDVRLSFPEFFSEFAKAGGTTAIVNDAEELNQEAWGIASPHHSASRNRQRANIALNV